MVGDSHWAAIALIIAGGLVASAQPTYAEEPCQPCVLGVVLDSRLALGEEAREQIEREITDLSAPGITVVFPDQKRWVSDSTLHGVRQGVEALLTDPEVDLVLTLGPVGSSLVANRSDALPKPVVAALVMNSVAHGAPIKTTAARERVSGKSNLSYISISGDLSDELRRFRTVVPFNRLGYLANDALVSAVPQIEPNLQRVATAIGIDLTLIRMGPSVTGVRDALSADVEAVYVDPQLQLSAADFNRLVQMLIELRLPAFSSWGRSEVDRGLLMSLYLEPDLRRLGRRIALNVQRILEGEDGGGIPVDFRRSRRFALNMATARAVGVHPNWSTLTEAELLHDSPPGLVRSLDLAAAVREAVAVNLDLAVADRSVAVGSQQVRAARAALLPQISVSSVTGMFDRGRSEYSFGVIPRWFSGGTVGVSHRIYSDGARASAEIQGHLQAARRQSREEVRIEVAHQAAVGYLAVLRAKTIELTQRENLSVTRSNLELAHERRRLGVAPASEVVRWEHEIANNRRAVLNADAQRRVAEIALNRILHRPLEEPFATTDVDLNNPALLATAETIRAYAGNRAEFERFRDFVTEEGLASAPELKQLDATIRAKQRAVLATRRALRVPEVVATSDLSGLGRDAGGSMPALGPRQPPNLNWRFGIAAHLPLFEGGARRAQRTRTERELDELRLTRQAAAERVEQRIRSAMHFAGASFTGIDLAAEAARAARQNLVLITGAYQHGAVSILDLLDAQYAALVAEQTEVDAVHDYLIDVLDVHRAVGYFGLLMSPAELLAFSERLQQFFAKPGEAR